MSKHKKGDVWSLTARSGLRSKGTKLKKWIPAEVSERHEIADSLLMLKMKAAQALSFEPGQYVKVRCEDLTRRYSLVSAPHEEILEFCIERVPGGAMTARLWTLQRGDEVAVRAKAKGKLWLESRASHHLMVATVTGIAPFVSMVRARLHEGPRGQRFYVVQGARYADELIYHAELASLARQYPEFLTYVPTVSRPDDRRNAQWTGHTGRVSGLVASCIERFALTPALTVVYACGHPDMVKDVQGQCKPQGFRMQTERYWKE